MTRLLFRDDAYLQEAPAVVLSHTPEGGLVLDQTIFYPTGGGQPGDSGWLIWEGGRLPIATAVKAPGALGAQDTADGVALLVAEPATLPPPGTQIMQRLDWGRRHLHMRIHTALHLLSVVIPLPVTGGQISAERGRLDFDMPDPPENMAVLEDRLNLLIGRDLAVTDRWITEAELAAQPQLVKTMSVRPPAGQGRVRLVQIGEGAGQVDLQPCGGTHVARTAEIGRISLPKIEKKGRINRRVTLVLDA